MNILIQTANISKKDMINARASRPFAELTEYTQVKGAAVCEDVDRETGELRKYGYIFTENAVFAGSSVTAISGIEGLIEIMNDGESVEAKVEPRDSKNGRTFYILSVR